MDTEKNISVNRCLSVSNCFLSDRSVGGKNFYERFTIRSVQPSHHLPPFGDNATVIHHAKLYGVVECVSKVPTVFSLSVLFAKEFFLAREWGARASRQFGGKKYNQLTLRTLCHPERSEGSCCSISNQNFAKVRRIHLKQQDSSLASLVQNDIE
ncbi:MAG: hypothetical protein HY070_00595 [Chloroflexi bacterium]|nr:hypothetical protein [Chloroflexota bacterium]